MAEAKAVHRPAAQSIRDFMWAFLTHRREASPNPAPLSMPSPLQPSEPTARVWNAGEVKAPPTGGKGKDSIADAKPAPVSMLTPPKTLHTVVADEPSLLIERILGRR